MFKGPVNISKKAGREHHTFPKETGCGRARSVGTFGTSYNENVRFVNPASHQMAPVPSPPVAKQPEETQGC